MLDHETPCTVEAAALLHQPVCQVVWKLLEVHLRTVHESILQMKFAEASMAI